MQLRGPDSERLLRSDAGASVEPVLLAGGGLDHGPRTLARLGDGQRDLLAIDRIAHADIRATLRIRDENQRLAARRARPAGGGPRRCRDRFRPCRRTGPPSSCPAAARGCPARPLPDRVRTSSCRGRGSSRPPPQTALRASCRRAPAPKSERLLGRQQLGIPLRRARHQRQGEGVKGPPALTSACVSSAIQPRYRSSPWISGTAMTSGSS